MWKFSPSFKISVVVDPWLFRCGLTGLQVNHDKNTYVSNELLQSCPTVCYCIDWGTSAFSVGVSRQEYWSGLPFPSAGDLPNPGIEPASLMSPALAGRFFATSATKNIYNNAYCFCCSVAQLCPTLCNPMDYSTQGFPVLHHLQQLAQTCVHWVGVAIQPLVFPRNRAWSFLMSWLLTSSDQSIGASASASVLQMNIQGWFPLRLIGLISLQSKGLSRVFFSTTVQKHQFFGAQPSLWSNSHIHTWLLEKP